jgi:hypothetical protein
MTDCQFDHDSTSVIEGLLPRFLSLKNHDDVRTSENVRQCCLIEILVSVFSRVLHFLLQSGIPTSTENFVLARLRGCAAEISHCDNNQFLSAEMFGPFVTFKKR